MGHAARESTAIEDTMDTQHTTSREYIPAVTRLAQGRTLALLFLGYGSGILCRANLDVTIPTITQDADSGIGREDVGSLLALGTAAYCAGKLINGMVADIFGGASMFVTVFAISACASFLIGVSNGFGSFAALWMLNRFVQAGGWPAMTQVVRSWYEPDSWGKVGGCLSLASRRGAVLANLLLGRLLSNDVQWRSIFMISGGVLAVDVLINGMFLRSAPGTGARMLVLCVAIGCLCVITEFLSFVPLLLVDK